MIALFNKRTVIGGSRELMWAKISDCNGSSLTDVDVSMAIIPEDQRPSSVDWKQPNNVTHSGRVIRAGLLFEAPVPAQGTHQTYTVYARAVESPEEIWVICGQFVVI